MYLENTEDSLFSDTLFYQVRETQALILAPTRELAVQIQKVRPREAVPYLQVLPSHSVVKG